jgi:hypothetical protein
MEIAHVEIPTSFSLKRLKGFVLADQAGKFNSDVNFLCFCVTGTRTPPQPLIHSKLGSDLHRLG